MTKPITPRMHGILDYVVGTGLLVLPAALGLDKKVVSSYQAIGAAFLGVNALTDTPVGLKKVIDMKSHQRADASVLATLMLSTFTKSIRKDNKTLCFHLALLALTAGQYALTDFDYDSIDSVIDEF